MVNVEHHQNAYCHKQQGNRKQWVDFTYYFINRQQSSQNIICKYNDNPNVASKLSGVSFANNPAGPATKTDPTRIIKMTVNLSSPAW